MGLEEYLSDMETCCRCSLCKFIPLERVKTYEHTYSCPSIARYNFNAFSGGGRLHIGLSLLEGRLQYSRKILDILYNCQMCGACDVSCKYAMDMEVLDPINEIRITCVSNGYTVPALDARIEDLRKKGSMFSARRMRRGKWAEKLDVKEIGNQKAEILFHAGCRTCFDEGMWKAARSAVRLLKRAGVAVEIMGDQELCCGGRALQMGYRDDFIRQAQQNVARFNKSGAAILLTGCAECYHAFKILYSKFNMHMGLEVMHVTEYLARLINEEKLKPSGEVPLTATYHDPCHLGRQGEPYVPWQGEMKTGQIRRFSPPRPFRRGTHGVYEAPRAVLGSIPGIKLVEMDRTREYAWCCGAGGGVNETNPGFSEWTALHRIDEALSTGAEAIVTACPGCGRRFKDSIMKHGKDLKVFDVTELLDVAVEEGGRE